MQAACYKTRVDLLNACGLKSKAVRRKRHHRVCMQATIQQPIALSPCMSLCIENDSLSSKPSNLLLEVGGLSERDPSLNGLLSPLVTTPP